MNVKKRIEKVQWMGKIGKSSSKAPEIRIKSKELAMKKIKSLRWENIRLEKHGDLSVYLMKNFPEERNKWSDYVKEIKEYLNKNVLPELREVCDSIDKEGGLYYEVEWDLMQILLFDKYSNTGHGISFHEDILRIYENGNIPCGIKEGKYEVY